MNDPRTNRDNDRVSVLVLLHFNAAFDNVRNDILTEKVGTGQVFLKDVFLVFVLVSFIRPK